MNLKKAQAIIEGCLNEGRTKDAQPLAVAVLDEGGHLVGFAREDGASLFRFDIARAKALGALGMGADTSAIAERAKNNPVFFASISQVVGGQIAFSPGGVIIRNPDGSIAGSVGISGDSGEVDEQCARAGIEATELLQGAIS